MEKLVISVTSMKKAEAPLISVIMGVRYQREDLSLLKRSISSILNQTYNNFEFLICENGSTNAAKLCLQNYRRQDGRVRLIFGGGADTLAEKLNRCLDEAKGDYIARMDDDDWSAPTRLEKQMLALHTDHKTAFVGSNAELLQNGQPFGRRILPEYPTVHDFLFVQPYLHPALLFRKEPLHVIGGYCTDRRCDGCEDYDLLLRLYQAGYVGSNLQEPLLTYTLPNCGARKAYCFRWHEAETRYIRFKSLGLLPKAWPYVLKPLIVGFIPARWLDKIKKRRWNAGDR